MEQGTSALEKIFASCTLTPALSSKILIHESKGGEGGNDKNDTTKVSFSMTSFFIDSSGRSSFTLPLDLKFASKAALDEFLAAKCLDPPPQNLVVDVNDEEDNKDATDAKPKLSPSLLAFEVKSSPMEDTKEVTVEGVTILSSHVDMEKLQVNFQLKVTVRAVLHDDSLSSPSSPQAFSSSPRGSGSVGGSENFNFITDDEDTRDATTALESLPPKALNVVTSLQVFPVLTIQKQHAKGGEDSGSNNQNDLDNDDAESFELMALEMAAIPDKLLKQTMDKSHEVRLTPMILALTLTHAFTISVKSVPGPNSPMGNTLVSLTMQHSNSHAEKVTVTNIALHPGHSREDMEDDAAAMGGEHELQQSVVNMTKSVQWGYLPNTELQLPLSIGPHEAYSTILSVNAGEEMLSRAFVSPVSVTSYVGTPQTNNNNTTTDNDETCRVVVAGDAHWTTKLVAVEPADAFRIHMAVERNVTSLGEPFSVKLRIFNLSLDSRDLMLLLAKNEMKSTTPRAVALKEESVNSAVVSEADGYTFGVWGISDDDDGTVRLNRDYDLLAIDAALVLGVVEGQHAITENLRFLPLKLGRLKVPNWKLYDKLSGRWYHCSHNLSMVAVEN